MIRLLWNLSLENMQTDMTKFVLEILVLSPGDLSGFVYKAIHQFEYFGHAWLS